MAGAKNTASGCVDRIRSGMAAGSERKRKRPPRACPTSIIRSCATGARIGAHDTKNPAPGRGAVVSAASRASCPADPFGIRGVRGAAVQASAAPRADQ
jgi:hypothetical protein